MEIVTRKGEGLFPSPREIALQLLVPRLGHHVQARGRDALRRRRPPRPRARAAVHPARRRPRRDGGGRRGPAADRGKARKGRVLAADDLSSVFGVDIDMGRNSRNDGTAPAKRGRRAARTKQKADQRSGAAKKPASKKVSMKAKAASRKASRKKTRTTRKR